MQKLIIIKTNIIKYYILPNFTALESCKQKYKYTSSQKISIPHMYSFNFINAYRVSMLNNLLINNTF